MFLNMFSLEKKYLEKQSVFGGLKKADFAWPEGQNAACL